jgi:hypothetical protein
MDIDSGDHSDQSTLYLFIYFLKKT